MFLLKAAAHIIPFVSLFGRRNNNNNNYNDDIRRELSRQIEELRREKERINERNLEHMNKISELEQKLKDNIEEQQRKEIQRKIELEEEKRKEELKKLTEIKKRQNDILECKKVLSDEFSSCILNVINNFNKESDKWILSLEDENLKMKLEEYKKRLVYLFDELFSFQGIKDKINNKFIDLFKENANFRT